MDALLINVVSKCESDLTIKQLIVSQQVLLAWNRPTVYISLSTLSLSKQFWIAPCILIFSEQAPYSCHYMNRVKTLSWLGSEVSLLLGGG